MADILERAKQKQREEAHAATICIRLDFLQDMITEIETLRRHQMPRAIGSISEITDKQLEKK